MTNNDERLFRLEDKIDTIKDTIGEINVTLAAQHESLKEHMARTKQLEDIVAPLQKHAVMTQGALKLVSGGVALLSVVHTVMRILEGFHKI
jgi:uncharacterized coiled-coil protein SlyX